MGGPRCDQEMGGETVEQEIGVVARSGESLKTEGIRWKLPEQRLGEIGILPGGCQPTEAFFSIVASNALSYRLFSNPRRGNCDQIADLA